MKRTVLAIGLMSLLAVSGVAEKDSKQEQPKGTLKSDYSTVIREFDKAACARLGLKASVFPGGEGNVTRAEVIAAMDMLLSKYKEKFRMTPRPYDVYPEVIDEFNADAKTREQLRTLSRWGMIGPVSVLVANKSDQILEGDLGDALGYYFSRVMTYSHQPDPLWSPDLQGE